MGQLPDQDAIPSLHGDFSPWVVCLESFVSQLPSDRRIRHFNFYFKDTVTAWNGITTTESNKLQPGTALYVHCLKEACAEGYKIYNLGSSLGKQTLIDFKESLGGELYSYSRYRRRSLLGKIVALVKPVGG